MEKILSDNNIRLILLCGKEDLEGSEIVIINKDEIEESMFSKNEDKNSITLYRAKNYSKYQISRGGGRINDIEIPANRIETIEEQLVSIT